MATIIDSLLVTLGLDSSDFDNGKNRVEKGLKSTGNEAEKTGAKLKKSGKDGGESFDKVAKGAAGFLAILGGTVAVKRFIEQTVESNAALDRLSQNLNASVSTVSSWSNAAELAGGSAEGLQGTFDMLSRAQTELQITGQSGLIPYLSMLGVSLADAHGKARPVNDLLLDLSDKFGKLDRPTANNIGRMMGIDAGTMSLLLKGRGEVELMIARQKDFGAVSKKQAEESSRLQRATIETRQTFAAFGRELVSNSTPALEQLFAVLGDVGAWMIENKEAVTDFLAVLALGLAGIAAAVIPINVTALAVTGLAAAIAGLYQDYQTWKRGGDSLIDWTKWEPGINKAGEGIRWLKDMLEDLVYRAIAAADVLGAVFEGDWKRAKFAIGEFMSGNGKKYGEPEKPKLPETPTPTNANGAERERATMDYFIKQGWSKEQAAGITANIARESSFNSGAVGDNGKAYGLAQWHPDRQAEFKKQFGKDIKESSFDDQLAFINHELTRGGEQRAGERLRKTDNAQDAAATISKYYERPAAKHAEAAERGNMALALVSRYAPAPAPAERPTAFAGIPGASMAAQGAGAPQIAKVSAPAPIVEGDKSVETHIGEIKVYTQATDAAGIAGDMGKSMDYLFTSQANYGLT